MNKAELIQAIVEQSKLTKKEVSNALDALIDTIQSSVQNGDTVSLVGFGSFQTRQRSARTCRNPKTGEQISVEAKTVPVFKAGKKFKEAVNG